MPEIKNFSLSEFACHCGCAENHTKLELLEGLQIVRNNFNEKITIVSGYRCLGHNRSIGSKDTSSHIKGLAADILVYDTGYAFKILKSIFDTGIFTRIGFGEYKGKLHLHVDRDTDKVQDRLWGY
jgi:uncharacterized protein YcbK (DUF882 family)